MEQLIKNLTQKNEELAMQSAREIINGANVEAFKKLSEKSDFLFDFVRENVCKRLFNAATKENYKNIISFFDIYDETYSEVFAKILSKYADDELKYELFELLKNGTDNQKAYCAKFFELAPFEDAGSLLNKEAFSDFPQLSENAIRALAKMQDNSGLCTAYEKLNSKDGFEVLKGIRFLMQYPDFSQLDKVVEAAVNSSVPENAAEEIANVVDMLEFAVEKQTPDRLLLLNSIINGLGEILPLYQLIDYKIFEVARELINQSYEEENSQVAQVLLNLYSKCKLFFENDEYTYDEDIDTKNELKKILTLLSNQGESFWAEQKNILFGELDADNKRIAAALQVIKELNLDGNPEKIAALTENGNEMIVCLAAETLAQIKKLDLINIDEVVKKIQNPNIAAILQNLAIQNK